MYVCIAFLVKCKSDQKILFKKKKEASAHIIEEYIHTFITFLKVFCSKMQIDVYFIMRLYFFSYKAHPNT